MANLTPTSLAAGSGSGTSVSTPSVTPGANHLILLAIEAEVAVGSVPSAPSTVTGNGLTWVLVTSIAHAGTTQKKLFVYRALGAAPTTGAITITWGSSVTTYYNVVDWANCDTSGTNGSGAIVASAVASNLGTGTNLAGSAWIPGWVDDLDAMFSVISNGAGSAVTPGYGLTEIAEPSNGKLETSWALNVDLSGGSWASYGTWASIAIEIKPATRATVTPTNWPTHHLELSLSTDGSSGWIDLSSRLVEANNAGDGRTFELDTFEANLASFTCRNNDLALDPDNPNGPYYNQLDIACCRIRFYMTWQGRTYYLWDGKIQDIDPAMQGYNEMWAVISVHSALGVMADRMLQTNWATLTTTGSWANGNITLTTRGPGKMGFGGIQLRGQSVIGQIAPPAGSDLYYQSNGRANLAANLSLEIDFAGNVITAQNSTDGNKKNSGTAADLCRAINSHAVVGQLVQATIAPGNNGSGIWADFPKTQFSGGYPQEKSDSRFLRVLDTILWKANRIVRNAATETIQSMTFGPTDDIKALQHLQDVQRSEVSAIYADGRYRMVFEGRTWRDSATVQATFSDNPSGGQIPYVGDPDPKSKRDDNYLYNYIAVTRQGGNVQIIQDSASITKNEQHDYSVSVICASDGSAANIGTKLLARYKNPKTRIDQIVLKPVLNDAQGIWTQCLARRISDLITVNRTYPAAAGVTTYLLSINCFIEKVGWKFVPNRQAQFTWQLSRQ